ncbi:hypothetical protein DHEL01_v204601 [Diaporthe helianthi]|uniref:Rossmann-fold NAD(P)(+)-binding protein n=1 Tax=Diaporthe helianthi TaxID=158607 RepID=A0A2P5I3C7_DIAHE|nr:hypothetical protein DHEL01_v204601 [Diaporthe helianthi]
MDHQQRAEAIHVLDLKYRGTMHQTDLTVKDEEARRLKLRVIVLRDEVAVLRDQLTEKDDRISNLSQKYEDIAAQLGRMNQTCKDQADQLGLQARQQSDLKAELQALNNMSHESSKTLAEKLALSRELAVLKPEIDHLRSQLSHQKDVLAEKLALERQLSTLETELADERRAAEKVSQRRESEDKEANEELQQRVADLEKQLAAEKKASRKAKKSQEKEQTNVEDALRQQVSDLEARLAAEQEASETARKTHQKVQSDTEAELRQQVADLEKKLADDKRTAQKSKRSKVNDDKEQQSELQQKVQELEEKLAAEAREAERARRASEKEVATANDQVEMLTQRVEEFKNKLKEVRAELKEVRAELTQAQTAPARTTTTTVPLKDNENKRPLSKAKPGKKRGANEISVDEMMMDTPGHVEGRGKRTLKKRGVDLTTVGEKSTFSITPFLEKSNTISLAETIEEEDEEPSVLYGKGDPAAPIIEPEAEAAEDIPIGTAEKPAKSVSKALKATKPKAAGAGEKKSRGRPKAQALKESSPNTNVPSAASRSLPGSKPASLEKVVEEPEEKPSTENIPTASVTGIKKSSDSKEKSVTSAFEPGNVSLENPEPKKKKRKLLGASTKGTLFDKDEDAGEAEAAAVPKTGAAAGGGKRKPVGLKASKGPVSTLAKNAFGGKAFSPLKRDRRGVNASFLA